MLWNRVLQYYTLNTFHLYNNILRYVLLLVPIHRVCDKHFLTGSGKTTPTCFPPMTPANAKTLYKLQVLGLLFFWKPKLLQTNISYTISTDNQSKSWKLKYNQKHYWVGSNSWGVVQTCKTLKEPSLVNARPWTPIWHPPMLTCSRATVSRISSIPSLISQAFGCHLSTIYSCFGSMVLTSSLPFVNGSIHTIPFTLYRTPPPPV